MPARSRARSAEAKTQRRDAILKAAVQQFLARGLSDLTMADIASSAGLAKGTLYLYFETKEEVFLAVLETQLDAWLDEVDGALAAGTGHLPASALTDLFAGTVDGRPMLRRLLSVLGTVLEHNVEYERALRFRWRLAGRLTATGSQLERRTVFLRPGDGTRLLLQLVALMVGLQQQAEPAPVVRRILDAPGLEPLRVDFGQEFRAALRALLTGLERTN